MHTLCCDMQIPIGGEDNFQGMVDLVRMKGITWDGEVTSPAIWSHPSEWLAANCCVRDKQGCNQLACSHSIHGP